MSPALDRVMLTRLHYARMFVFLFSSLVLRIFFPKLPISIRYKLGYIITQHLERLEIACVP